MLARALLLALLLLLLMHIVDGRKQFVPDEAERSNTSVAIDLSCIVFGIGLAFATGNCCWGLVGCSLLSILVAMVSSSLIIATVYIDVLANSHNVTITY